MASNPPESPVDPLASEHRLFTFTLERIVFFSDAVFAIAITLLAIDLRVPALPGGQTDRSFLEALATLGPSLFAFCISFLAIALFWVGHYRTFRYVVDADGRLIAINLGFLFSVAILPFPTSIIAAQAQLPSAAIVYASFVVVTGIMSTVLWIYPAQVAHLVSPGVTPAIARHVTIRAAVIPIVFGLSIPVALISPPLAWLMWFLAAPVQAIVTRRHPPGGSLGLGGATRA
jgi:uncharacterized membrane protein